MDWGSLLMIHGVVQHGGILPLDPLPAEWGDGRHVVIEDAGEVAPDERAEIEQWYADIETLGPAQYGPGERAALDNMLSEADREAKDSVRRSWVRFDDALPARHQPPQRGDQR